MPENHRGRPQPEPVDECAQPGPVARDIYEAYMQKYHPEKMAAALPGAKPKAIPKPPEAVDANAD